jgi:hypothetical protein
MLTPERLCHQKVLWPQKSADTRKVLDQKGSGATPLLMPHLLLVLWDQGKARLW